jgi:cellulose synthase/poly-beta-1,6-N-acetylglucosamine synthase-like glycosyltransferase
MTPSLDHFYRLFIVPVTYVVLAYFVALGLFYLVLYISAALEMHRYLRQVRAEKYTGILSSELAPSISMLVPAHNEETGIIESVRALLTLAYPQLEIVVVDDGSTDKTLDVMISTFDLLPIQPVYDRKIPTRPVKEIYHSSQFPNLIVVAKENGGKADALNVGLNISSSELVCAIDADTILDPDGLRRLVRPFIRSEEVVGAGATIRVANGCTVTHGRLASERGPHRAVAGIQAVEYLRAFLFGRPGWNRLGGNLLISGAFGLFRRQNLIECDGYAKTVGEDMELIVRLRRHGYETGRPARIEFVPDGDAYDAQGTRATAGTVAAGFLGRHVAPPSALYESPLRGTRPDRVSGVHPVRMGGADHRGDRCGRGDRRSDPRSAFATVRHPVLLAGLWTGNAALDAGPDARGALVPPLRPGS